MVELETRLRQTIDRLRFDLACRDTLIEDLHARLAKENPVLPQRRCIYCGDPCHGPACVLHRDLLTIDKEAPCG